MLKHKDLPFVVTGSQIKYKENEHVAPASPEVLLLALLIKEVQALNQTLTENKLSISEVAEIVTPLQPPVSTPTPSTKK